MRHASAIWLAELGVHSGGKRAMSGWAAQGPPPPRRQRPYGAMPGWQMQQQQQGGGLPPLPPNSGGWAGPAQDGGVMGGANSAPGWDQRAGGLGGAPYGGAADRYSGGNGRHSGGGNGRGDWAQELRGGGGGGGGGALPPRPAAPYAQGPPPAGHRPPSSSPQAGASATGGWGADRRASAPPAALEGWRQDPMVGRSTSRARPGADEEAMKAIVGSLSQTGQREVLDAFESLRKDGSFDKLVKNVQSAMERGGEMGKLRELTRKEADSELRDASRGRSEAELKFKTLMKQIRERVENYSAVPVKLNNAVNRVMGSAAFSELMDMELKKQEEAAAAAKEQEEAEAAAVQGADDDMDEDDNDEDDESSGSESTGDDDGDDGGSAWVRGAEPAAAGGGGEDDDSSSSDDDEGGGVRVRGANPAAAAAAATAGGGGGEDEESSSSDDDEGGARVRGSGTGGARVRGTGIDAPSAAALASFAAPVKPAPAAAEPAAAAKPVSGLLSAGQVIEVFDELEDEWQRATVVAHVATKGNGAEYSVRYDATGEQQSELLLPGSYRLVQPAPAAAPAAAPVAAPRAEVGRAKRAAPNDEDGETGADSKRARPDAEAAATTAAGDGKKKSRMLRELESDRGYVDETSPTRPAPAAAPSAEPAATAAAATAEPPAAGNDDDEDEEWLTTGSEWLGKRVARVFGLDRFIGVVISWVRENTDGDPPLWKIQHEDGDEEDLEEYELKKSHTMLLKDEKAEKKRAEVR